MHHQPAPPPSANSRLSYNSCPSFGRSGLFGPPLCGGSAPATPPLLPTRPGAASPACASPTGLAQPPIRRVPSMCLSHRAHPPAPEQSQRPRPRPNPRRGTPCGCPRTRAQSQPRPRPNPRRGTPCGCPRTRAQPEPRPQTAYPGQKKVFFAPLRVPSRINGVLDGTSRKKRVKPTL